MTACSPTRRTAPHSWASRGTGPLNVANTPRCRRCQRPESRREAIGATFKAVLAEFGLKMPKLAMPVRLLVAGQLQTPSIDAVLELFGRETVLRRIAAGLDA